MSEVIAIIDNVKYKIDLAYSDRRGYSKDEEGRLFLQYLGEGYYYSVDGIRQRWYLRCHFWAYKHNVSACAAHHDCKGECNLVPLKEKDDEWFILDEDTNRLKANNITTYISTSKWKISSGFRVNDETGEILATDFREGTEVLVIIKLNTHDNNLYVVKTYNAFIGGTQIIGKATKITKKQFLLAIGVL